jgi:hypothetical protein
MKILSSTLRIGALPALLLVFALWGIKTPAHKVNAAAPALHPSTAMVQLHLDDGDDDNCARFRRNRDDDDTDGDGRGDDSRIRQGFAIAPVPLNLKGKNCSLVGLGSYLVNTNECVDCHTHGARGDSWFLPGGNPFKGEPKKVNVARYLGGGTAFGPFVSRDLTPDAAGLPAGFTFEQFRFVIRTGADLQDSTPTSPELLQVMPWPLFQDLTDHDLRAMYEYLRAIPCIPDSPGLRPHPCS